MSDTALSTHPSSSPAAAGVTRWLLICAAAVLAMALIGAVTRLTESGLSIVEWKPVAGALPPLSEAAWQHEYDLYQQSPQGMTVNKGMDMHDFKVIFFWEWAHRLWGRLIGLIFALPLALFWRRLPSATRPAFIGLLALGVAQGAMGWFMVKSGLVDQPMVSHYRLAAHLLLAAVIYAGMLRLALRFGAFPATGVATPDTRRLRRSALIALGMVLTTLVWGAFVAGLDAGLLYNTFPKMDAHWLPPEMLQHNPIWRAFFEEPATVQFTHRVLAILTVCKLLAIWYLSRRLTIPARARFFAAAAGVMACVQAGLGIATLLTHVNIVLATAHQGGAFIVIGLLAGLIYHLTPPQALSGSNPRRTS